MTTQYGYVVVHETKDAAQGEMLAELLRNEGIEARFRGPSTTLVGVARSLTAMAVEVPVDQEERARQFLQDLEDTTGSAGADPCGCADTGPCTAACSDHYDRRQLHGRGRDGESTSHRRQFPPLCRPEEARRHHFLSHLQGRR